MVDLSGKTHAQLIAYIRNYEREGATSLPFFHLLLEERARRSCKDHALDVERSLTHLKSAAIAQTCTTYGGLAAANGVEWSKARHRMNSAGGHLDRVLDVCYSRDLPLLMAICVNRDGLADGELSEDALLGFAEGARRLGLAVNDPLKFHHACRDRCWEWGRQQGASI